MNHPHIASIYGLEESGEQKFLVMELAAGETLAERIRRGPLPVDEAMKLAAQIAEALEAANIANGKSRQQVEFTPGGDSAIRRSTTLRRMER